MQLLFVFSAYPGETFAIVEVDALRDRGVDVVPLSLRGGHGWLRQRHANHDRHHDEVVVLPFTALSTWLAFGRFLLRYPLFVAGQIGAALRENALQPEHLVRSLYVCLKAPAVVDLVRRRGIDGVHIYWAHYPALIIPFLKRALPDLPVTAFLGAYSLVKRVPSGPRALAQADVLTTHFDGHVAEIQSGWIPRKRPIALNYHGIHLEPLKALRRERAGEPRLVIVSRLAVNKTVNDGIRTFALVHRKHPEFHLDVIGDGPCRKSLERLVEELGIADWVTFHGLLPQDKAFSIVAGATALIMASLSPYETYPNAVKEAMALGVPCAGYAIPGIADFDVAGRAVRLAPPGDYEALAKVTIELIENPELARATAAAADIRVRDFDVQVTSARQLELYKALVQHAPLPGWVLQPADA